MDEIEELKKQLSELKFARAYENKKQQQIIDCLIADSHELEDEALKLKTQCAELGAALVEAIQWNWLDLESELQYLDLHAIEQMPEALLLDECEIIGHALNNSGYWRNLK